MTDPETRPRSLLWRCVLAVVFLLAAIGAVGGYTGLVRTEYKTSPLQEAILVSIMSLPYGLIVGLVIGASVDARRQWRWKKRQ